MIQIVLPICKWTDRPNRITPTAFALHPSKYNRQNLAQLLLQSLVKAGGGGGGGGGGAKLLSLCGKNFSNSKNN